MSGLGRLDLRHVCLLLHTNFYKQLNEASNGALNKLYRTYCESVCKSDASLSIAQLLLPCF
jgi:hypothetical protein